MESIVGEIIRRMGRDEPVRLLFAGPAGVGKTHMAKLIQAQFSIQHIEHDDLKKHGDPNCRCKMDRFDPQECFDEAISPHQNFILDMGAGTAFRNGIDNDAMLNRFRQFKQAYGVTIVLLVGKKEKIREQFQKKGVAADFEEYWHKWEIAYKFWSRCSDIECSIG